jgi:hypothetical protein
LCKNEAVPIGEHPHAIWSFGVIALWAGRLTKTARFIAKIKENGPK